MDCNNERALRTKEVAERKFAKKDYVGAKKFAQKAKDLCPELDFISLFITILNIFLSKEKIVDGQPNWYGVLGLEKPATVEEISKNYFNLFEAVKAGRNNVIGTEEALQTISEAFRVLTGTFWAMCPRCQFSFQYLNNVANKVISCSYCNKVFLAVPLPSECHPTDPRPMSHFKQSVAVVLKAPSSSAKPVGQRRRSKKVKKDDGECSTVESCGDTDAHIED